jgi:hypothetical protein
MRWLWASDFGHCGDDFSRYAQAAAVMVYGDLVGDDAENRGKRHGAAAGFGAWKL